MMRKLVLGKQCTGCAACANACDKNAIDMIQEWDGFLHPHIDDSVCIKCGKCVSVCARTRKQMYSSSKLSYAAFAEDKIRFQSSSGGVFKLLAEAIIQEGGVVCGAAYVDEYKVKHIIIKNEADILKLQTSKYVQSEIGDIYLKVKNVLMRNKKVLFTGTPCQVAGLKAFLDRKYDNLLTVDICCHGVPSQILFNQYLEEEYPKQIIEQINFRDKRDGWTYLLKLVVKTNEKEWISNIKEDPYYIAFSKRLSLRECCGECEYATDARCGDITLGDFWRIWDYDRALDDRKGTSLIIINSSNGKRLVEKIQNRLVCIKKVPFEYAILGNVTLKNPLKLSEYRNEFLKNVQTHSIRESLHIIQAISEKSFIDE